MAIPAGCSGGLPKKASKPAEVDTFWCLFIKMPHYCENPFYSREIHVIISSWRKIPNITFSQDQWCQTHTWKCLYSRSGSRWLPVIFEVVEREKCCCFSWIVVEHDWKCWNWCKGLTYDPWLLETAADQWTDLSLSPKRVDRLPWNVPVGLGGVYL